LGTGKHYDVDGRLIGTDYVEIPGGKARLTINSSPGFGADNAFETGSTDHVNRRKQGTYYRKWWSSGPWLPEWVDDKPISEFVGEGVEQKAPIQVISNGDAALRTKALTNPTRAIVNYPVALFELKDLPHMIHQAGAILSAGRIGDKQGQFWKHLSPTQRAASAYVGTQFGWAPLVQDLKNLFTATQLVEKRKKEWNNLFKGNGLRMRRKLTTDTLAGSYDSTVSGFHPTQTSWTATTEVWGTIRWTPTAAYPFNGPPPDDKIRNQILGLSTANVLDNVWQALPWSWLADYFFSLGDSLRAHAGGLELASSVPCIMCHKRTEYFAPPSRHLNFGNQSELVNVSLSGGSAYIDYKSRVVSPLSQPLNARWPLMGAGTVSILAGLLVNRAKGTVNLRQGRI
jgi:hypothetical protein